MEPEFLARTCKALGDPTRAKIFQHLLGCCCQSCALTDTGECATLNGPTVGEVCCNITGDTKVSSTISFHLKELREAGLITMEKKGQYQVCGVNNDTVSAMAEFFSGALASCNCGPNCC